MCYCRWCCNVEKPKPHNCTLVYLHMRCNKYKYWLLNAAIVSNSPSRLSGTNGDLWVITPFPANRSNITLEPVSYCHKSKVKFAAWLTFETSAGSFHSSHICTIMSMTFKLISWRLIVIQIIVMNCFIVLLSLNIPEHMS